MTGDNQQRVQKLRSLVTLFLVNVAFNWCVFSAALASTLSDARKAFGEGDLPRAVKILEPDIYPRPRLKGKDLSEARELYGITQFMLGSSAKAQAAFTELLAANPKAKLDKRYLLDPAVEPFFEKIKNSNQLPRGQTNISRGGGAAKQNMSKVQATPPPEPKRARQSAPPAAKPAAFSGLTVTANAPRVTVFADGIFVGAAGQKIALEPGIHEITVSGEGYETFEKKIKIEKGVTNLVKVTLKKVGEGKAQPRKNKKSNTAEKGKSRETRERPDAISDADDFVSQKPKRSVNFNQELPQERKAAQQARARKNLADKFFQEQPTQSLPPQQPPNYSPQQYQQPAPQPYMAPQQPMYPPQYQAPAYPAPGYQQQPYGQPQYPQGYPAPSYGYPQPDPYAAPAYPAPALPPAGEYGAPNPYEEEDEAGDSAAPQYSPRAEGGPYGSFKRRPRKKAAGSAGIALLPLGAGQFQNGDTLKGILFLAAEAGLVGYGAYVKFKLLPSAKAQFELDRKSELDNKAAQEDIDAKELERAIFIKKSDDIALYTFLGAGGVYLVGVIDAFINLDKKKTSRRADLTQPQQERKFDIGLQPQLNGVVNLKVSWKLD